MAKLDRFYVDTWGQERGNSTNIFGSQCTFFNHSPVDLHIQKCIKNKEIGRAFRFNLSYLEEPELILQLIEEWKAVLKPSEENANWLVWITGALDRCKMFSQAEGKKCAKE